MDQSAPLTAEEIVNEWSYDELVRDLLSMGKYSLKQIARNIGAEPARNTVLKQQVN